MRILESLTSKLVKRKFKPFIQLGPVDCGPANLVSLCRTYGIRMDPAHIRRLCQTNRAGTSLAGLSKAAEKLGFQAEIRPNDLDDLRRHRTDLLPAVVALKTRGVLLHYVLVYKFVGDRVIIMDPMKGILSVPFDELHRKLHRTEVQYETRKVELEANNADNQAAIISSLLSTEFTEQEALEMLARYDLFDIDDSIKYLEFLKRRDRTNLISRPAEVIRTLIRPGVFQRPRRFRTRHKKGQSGTDTLIESPLVLSLTPPASTKKHKRKTTSVNLRLFHYHLSRWRVWLPNAVLSLVLSFLGLALPVAGGVTIASLDTSWPPLIVVLVAILLLRLFSSYLSFSKTRIVQRCLQTLILRIKSGFLFQLHRADEENVKYRSPGELMSRFDETHSIANSVLNWMPRILAAGVTFIAAVAGVLYLYWEILVAQLILAVATYLVNEVFATRIQKLSRDVLEATSDFNRSLVESLRGFEALRLAGASDVAFFETDQKISELARRQFASKDWALLLRAVSGILYAMFSIAMLVFIYYELNSGEATPAMVVTSFSLAGIVTASFKSLLALRRQLETDSVVFLRYEELANLESDPELGSDVDEQPAHTSRRSSWQRILLQDVQYSHGQGPFSLFLGGLEFEAAESVCLMGSSGAGKSSLLDLLCGNARPQDGAVFVDDRQANPEVLRDLEIVRVEQEPFLITGTIRDNILFGATHVEDEFAIEAMKSAELDSAIRFSLDREIGGRRIGVSGGEAKRIVLARALMRRPRLLLLDETLSSTDWPTRRQIIENLRTGYPGMGIILTSHDPTDALLCDRAITLEKGRVVEDGPVDHLRADTSSVLSRLLSNRSLLT